MKKFYPANFPREKENFLKDLLSFLIEVDPGDRQQLFQNIRHFLKNKKETKFFPSLWMLNFVYFRHFRKKTISKRFLNLLRTTKTRSLSGIVPLSLFTKPKGSCPFNCVYCTWQKNAPKSYFADEAAVKRAIRNKYDPFEQTRERLIQFYLSGHPIDKVDIIIQGGTFSHYDKKYRQWFVKRIFDSCNSDIEKLITEGDLNFKKRAKDLNGSKRENEKARQRVVGITIETRPDFIDNDEIMFLRKLGVTRVEVGVQTTDDRILKKIKRGHTISNVFAATKLLREAGFKITYHIMPGLPGSNVKRDFKMLKDIFENDNFKPDAIKFYPTQVVWGTKLYKWYKKGLYKPMTEKELLSLVISFKKNIVPRWVRIHRLVRDLTVRDVAVDTFPSNFRQNIQRDLLNKNIKCRCIRCREIRDKNISGRVIVKKMEYEASDGKEYFIEAVDQKDQLLGFVRLRVPQYFLQKKDFFIKELGGAALIRELHIYGQQTPIGKKGFIQHQGLGRRLLSGAEKIAKKFQAQKIAVISGVGVRNYYRKLGYQLIGKGEYLIKNLG